MATKLPTPQPAYLQPVDDGLDFDAGDAFLSSLRTQPEPEPERSTIRAIADTGISGIRGVATGVRMISDVFGADNPVSDNLRNVVDVFWRDLQSAKAQHNERKVAEIMKSAENAGVLDQVMAAGKAFMVDPAAMTANALGTAAPTLAIAALPGGQAVLGARLGAMGVGAVQGVGSVKGSQYDTVYAELKAAGASEQEARQRASEAQAYTPENAPHLALGGALGAFAGSSGAERFMMRGANPAAGGVARRALMGAATEAIPEALQGGQEQYASNAALMREGFTNVTPMQGVWGNAALEGTAAGPMGAGFGALHRNHGDAIRAEKVPEVGALSKAVNAGIESEAQKVDAGIAPPPSPAPDRETAQAVIRGLNGQPRQEALQAWDRMNDPRVGERVRRAAQARWDLLARQSGMESEIAAQEAQPVEEANTLLLENHPTQTGRMLVGEDGSTRPETLEDAQARAQRWQEQIDLGTAPLSLNGNPRLRQPSQPIEDAKIVEPQPQPRTSEPVAEAQTSAPVAAPQETDFEPMQPGDSGNSSGKPIRSMQVAMAMQARAGNQHDIVRVRGGLALRPKVVDERRDVQKLREVPAEAADGRGDLDPRGDTALPVVDHRFGQGGEPTDPVRPDASVAASEPVQRQIGVQDAPLIGNRINRNWSAFAPGSGTKGVPRAEMPQIKAGDRSSLVQFLRARGIDYQTEVELDAKALKPTQAEFSPQKVEKAKNYEGTDRSILVSSDGHVLDGHHQWMAKREKGESIKAIVLNAPIDKLVTEAAAFPSATTAKGAVVADAPKSDETKPDDQSPRARRARKAAEDKPNVKDAQEKPNQPEAKAAEVEAPATARGDEPASPGTADTGTEVAGAEAVRVGARERRSTSNKQEKREAQRRAAREDFFKPGNVVPAYGGHDLVLAYEPKDSRGSWSVKVRRVIKQGDEWVPDPSDNRERHHSTEPSDLEIKRGPVFRRSNLDDADSASQDQRGDSEPTALTMSGDAKRSALELIDAEVSALSGKTVSIPIRIAETGQTASLEMDAADAVRDIKTRYEAAKRLLACL